MMPRNFKIVFLTSLLMNFDIDKSSQNFENCDEFYKNFMNWEFTGNEHPIIFARQQICSESSSQKDISLGIMTLYSFITIQKEVCKNFIDNHTIKRFNELVRDSEIDFRIKNQIIGFISILCQAEKSFIHQFWSEGLQDLLIEIISDDNPSVLLIYPIDILSRMANWVRPAYNKLIKECNLITILLTKIRLKLAIPEQYSVLNGLSSIIASDFADLNIDILSEIIDSVYSIIADGQQDNDQILGKTFKVIGSVLRKTEDPITIDLKPICECAIHYLQEKKRDETMTEIIEFMSDAIFANSEASSFFLEEKILDLFVELLKNASEELMIECFKTISSCCLTNPNLGDYLFESKFLEISVEILGCGTRSTKNAALEMLSYLIDPKSEAFNNPLALGIFQKYDIIDPLSDFLQLDETESESILLISKCLLIINTAIDVYSKSDCDKPSPPIQFMLNTDTYDRLEDLIKCIDETVSGLAKAIQNEVSKYTS